MGVDEVNGRLGWKGLAPFRCGSWLTGVYKLSEVVLEGFHFKFSPAQCMKSTD